MAPLVISIVLVKLWPRPVVEIHDFLVTHGIGCRFHRKPVTKGCEAAVDVRSHAVDKPISSAQELKTLMFQTKEGGGLVAVHIPGDKELPRVKEGGEIDYAGIEAGIEKATGRKISLSGWAQRLPSGEKIIYGRLNPVALTLTCGEDNVQHFYDLPEDRKVMYTNAGMNTWGVRMDDIHAVMHAVGAEPISIAVDKVAELKGTPVEQQERRR